MDNNTIYWDKIDKLVDDYNNARHSSIKMTPVEASKKKKKNKVWSYLYGDSIYLKPGKSKFAIGDRHRRTGNFLPGGAVNHLPKKFSQVAQIFTKQSSYDALT